jgi:catechol 2,3-dioxygenase-like lactoylglutathione lyase family enzyme
VHLDDRDAALGQEVRLVAADQPAPEHDGEVRGDPLALVERLVTRVYMETGSFQLGNERGLPRREQEHTVSVRPHDGIFPSSPAFEASVRGTNEGMKVETLDHVALWVEDRDALADFLVAEFGLHVIERTDKFTLVGGDARLGKLTLFAAEGPRHPGVLAEIAIRVPAQTPGAGEHVVAPGNVPLLRIESAEPVADLDHVRFRVPEPESAFAELAGLGFTAEDGRLKAGEAYLVLEQGDAGEKALPLLNHLGLRVQSAEEHIKEARRRGLDIADVVDAANTYAVFIWGPSGIKLEYVEHKPTFSLV